MSQATPAHGRALRGLQLRVRLADSLRQRLHDEEWGEGDRLPAEAELAAEYGVSRSTVRAALQQLETQGLTITRHGMGTYVSPYGRAIKTGLQELRSMTDTIRAHGMEPHMDYRSADYRGATEEEAGALDLAPGDRVLATERAVLADGVVVAFSYEAIPAAVLPADLDLEELSDSLFEVLDGTGFGPRTSVAEVHAASGSGIGWGERDPEQVYVYLHQVHYDGNAHPVVLSRTYFHEGRFQFSILRVR